MYSTIAILAGVTHHRQLSHTPMAGPVGHDHECQHRWKIPLLQKWVKCGLGKLTHFTDSAVAALIKINPTLKAQLLASIGER